MQVPDEEYKESSEVQLREDIRSRDNIIRELSEKLSGAGRVIEEKRTEIEFLRKIVTNLSGMDVRVVSSF